MSLTPTPPRSLEAWLQQLDEIRLPIASASSARVLQSLLDNRSSIRDIAEQMEASPMLALALLRAANLDSSEPASGLELAIARLGLTRSEELLRGLPTVAEADIPLALRQLQLIGRHATQQADGLFGSRLARLWPEIHWGSLLFLAPLWPLACAYPQLLRTWEQRVLVRGESAERVERELLGVPVRSLCLALAEHWRLPDWIVQGYRLLRNDRRMLVKALHVGRDHQHPLQQQQRLDQDPALRRWLTQPANTILLANGLAVAAHASWSDRHTLRWQGLTGLYLQLPLEEVQQQVHQQAVRSARQVPRDLWHPAQALLWPSGSAHLREFRPSAPGAERLALWRQHCARLLRQPSEFANLVQLTACAREALAACGLQRIMLLRVERSRDRLLAQQIHGLPSPAALTALSIEQSPVLRRLLAEPGQLRLSPENIRRYSARLPRELKSLFAGEQFILQSLAHEGRVVMLLVVDQDGHPFNQTTLQAFGKTLQCLERGLASLLRRPSGSDSRD